jgi:uncharacterized membrane protein (DUF2068 family)
VEAIVHDPALGGSSPAGTRAGPPHGGRPSRPGDKPPKLGVRTVAVFEAAKGLVVLLAGSSLLLFMDRDLQVGAGRLVGWLHLDPAGDYPQMFLRLAEAASVPGRLPLIALVAAFYATFRFVEAFGLWRERRWAEWVAVVTGSAYIPFEVYALIRGPAIEPLAFLVVNLLIVSYLGWQLRPKPAVPTVT